MSLENCVEYLKLASNYALDTVASHDTQQDSVIECIDLFILENISDLYLLKKHTKISQFETMKQLVASDEIKVAELTLYNIIADWLLADPSRKEYCDELMKHIRFMLIPLTDLERLQAHPDFDTEVVKDKIEKALKYVSVPVAKKIQWESPVDQVRGRPSITANFNDSLQVLLDSCNVYDNSSDGDNDGDDESNDQNQSSGEAMWIKMQHWPVVFGIGTASFKNFLFVCGGSDTNLIPSVRECHVFDPVTWQWDKIAPMNIGRHSFPLVVHEEELYAIGGETLNDSPIDSIEKYSLRDNCWETVAHYHVPASHVAAVSAEGLLYMYGGESDEGEVESFQSFDPCSSEWKSLPLCHGEDIGYIDCTLLLVLNYLCLFSSWGSLRNNDMMCFQISTQQWIRFFGPSVNQFSGHRFYQRMDQSIYSFDRSKYFTLGLDIDNKEYYVQHLPYRKVPEYLFSAAKCLGWLIIPYDRLVTGKMEALRKPNA